MRETSAVPLLALRIMSSGLGALKVNEVSPSDNANAFAMPGEDNVVEGEWEVERDTKSRANGEGKACMGDGE